MNGLNHVIFCIIDDVRSSHFYDLIERGYLPNIKKLMENGIYSKNCITDFPSVTYPTQASMITGTFTGNFRKEPCHGVPSMNWLDRAFAPPRLRSYMTYGTDKRIQIYKINDDLGDNCQTFLEMVGDANTASITQFINRGAKYFYPERKSKLALYYLLLKHTRRIEYNIWKANTVVVHKLLETFKRPKKYFATKEAPLASLLWFMSSDILMHLYGVDSNIYKKNLYHIDKVLGLFLKELKTMGLLDSTAIAIASDHGNYAADKIGNLNDFFERNGLTHFHHRKNLNGNIDVAEFTGVGLFNFRSPNLNKRRWNHPSNKELENFGPKKVNLFNEMFKIDGSELMYYRGENNTLNSGTIQVRQKSSRTGEIISASIEYNGIGNDFKTKYLLEKPDQDPFNYIEDEFACRLIDNKFHTNAEWLTATHHLDYPLYIDLLPRHFKNPRSSDIILSTRGRVVYNFKHGKKKKGGKFCHDIGLRQSAVVPLIIGGTDEIPHVEIPYCNITDIVPTLLKMVDKRPHESVIGRSLI
jgi:hypothetical protein